MALTTRVWSAGKLLILAGALFLTYIAFAVIGMRLALKTRDVIVPSLAGKTVNEATAMLTEAGLNLKVEEGAAAGSEGGGRPDRQRRNLRRASAGRERAQHQVWVSAGPRSMIVPPLSGESERTAQLRAAAGRTGARLGRGDPIVGLHRRNHHRPVSGSRSRPRRQVSLLVNRGERGARPT